MPSWSASAVRDDFLLDAAELLLAVVGEDVGDGAAGGLDDRARRCPAAGRAWPWPVGARSSTCPNRACRRVPLWVPSAIPKPRRPPRRRALSHRLLLGHRAQVRVDVATGLGQRVAAELLQYGAGQYQRHHRLDHHAGGGHRTHVGALVDRHGFVAGGHVHGGQCARHGRDRLHRRADPQRLAVGHAALETAGAVGGAHDAVRAGVHLVVGQAAAAPRGLETVADLDALDRLDAHHRGGELTVEAVVTAGERPEPDRQSDARRPRRHRRACRRPSWRPRSRRSSTLSAALSNARTGLSSIAARSPGCGGGPA